MKHSDFKICSFLAINHGLGKNLAKNLGKTSIFGRNTNIILKAFNQSLCPKTSPEKLFSVPKEVLRHAEIPWEINKCKMPTSKFGHFFEKNRGLTPWEKVDFWTKYKYSLKSCQSNQCVRKRPLRNFLGLPRDQGQRNRSQKMKSV